MAITTINVGNIANDGTGDDLREAFIKVNQNFADVDVRIGNIALTAVNLGTTGEGVYSDTVDGTLQFKKLVPGQNTSLTSNGETITINSSGGISEVLTITDNGSLVVTGANYLGLQGGEAITTRVSGNNVIFDLDNVGVLARDSAPTLTANLQADDFNIQNVGSINSNSFIGPLTGLVHGVDIRDINQYFQDYWEFGPIIDRRNYDSIIEFLLADYVVDFGDIIGLGVKQFTVDLGPIVP